MAATAHYSRQREALLRVLQGTTSHPTADWLYTELRREFPNISLGTVYRNLKLLSDNGTILKLSAGTGTEHYDGSTFNHYHFVCIECGCVSDINMESLTSIDSEVEKLTGGKIKRHSLVFYGNCEKCKKIKTKNKKES